MTANKISAYAISLTRITQTPKVLHNIDIVGLDEDDFYDHRAVQDGMTHGSECIIETIHCEDREEQASHWYNVGGELSNRGVTTTLPSQRFKRTHRW